LTDELGLKIMMLQPFANFEGWKKGTHDKERQQAFDKAKGWIKIMEAAGITLLQVNPTHHSIFHPITNLFTGWLI
jgi:hypothetical protein